MKRYRLSAMGMSVIYYGKDGKLNIQESNDPMMCGSYLIYEGYINDIIQDQVAEFEENDIEYSLEEI